MDNIQFYTTFKKIWEEFDKFVESCKQTPGIYPSWEQQRHEVEKLVLYYFVKEGFFK